MTPFGITLAGMEELISDMKKKGVNVVGVVVHPHDHHDLAQEVMSRARETNHSADYKRDVVIVAGVRIVSDVRQRQGKASVIHRIKPGEVKEHSLI